MPPALALLAFKCKLTIPIAHHFAHLKQKWIEGNHKYKSHTLELMVRGYHVYKEIWFTAVGEEMSSVRETEILQDPFTVAIARTGVTVGHIPRKISSTCSSF